MRRAAAGPHVKPVNGVARLQAGLRQAAHVSRFAGAFEPVRQDNLANNRAGRPLLLDQNLHIGLGPIEFRLHGIASGVEPPRPEISGSRQDVMVGYDGKERPQAYILA